MKRICAWCGKEMGETGGSDGLITHGICLPCARSMMAGRRQHLSSFLDMIEAPVLLVDDQGIVKTANRMACEALKKDIDVIEDYAPGDVMECINASQPEGCGNTVHCKACAIRKLIMETHATGKSYLRQPAYQDIDTAVGVKRMHYFLSTEKVGEIVFLRIDEANKAD
ncbi:MAG: hypothetical protein AB1656_20950 [Candidatus Omnitrophota bacterium]